LSSGEGGDCGGAVQTAPVTVVPKETTCTVRAPRFRYQGVVEPPASFRPSDEIIGRWPWGSGKTYYNVKRWFTPEEELIKDAWIKEDYPDLWSSNCCNNKGMAVEDCHCCE